jgi:HK97 family phage prohead protease
MTTAIKSPPPKDGLVRAARPGLEVRAAEDGGMPKLTGYMLRFNEWTEINSIFEGRFLERVAPGAAKKTLKENASMRILFNHGHDPHVGEKPLAEPRFGENAEGVYYDDPELFDTSYNRDLVPGLEKGQYGSSFKFRSVVEEFDEDPGVSEDNPDGIPERTIKELRLYEGGPVVFPAYAGSSAGVRTRSLTDQVFIDGLKRDPARAQDELGELFAGWVLGDPERARKLIERAEAEPAADDAGAGDGGDGGAHDAAAEPEPESDGEKPDPDQELDGEPPAGALPDEEASDDARDKALPKDGAETSHSDQGSRDAPVGAPGSRPTPPWRADQKRTPPWRSAEKEK